MMPVVIVVMGVTGAGKTTVGERLADAMGWPFHDADDFHPASNVEKMRRGIPLTDSDREPWLRAMREAIEAAVREGRSAVFTCSALKASYRETLAGGLPDVRFVLLHGDRRLLAERLEARRGHFMNPALLDSQIDTLEWPEEALLVDIALDPAAQVEAIRAGLGIG